jgi:hypothetical protein
MWAVKYSVCLTWNLGSLLFQPTMTTALASTSLVQTYPISSLQVWEQSCLLFQTFQVFINGELPETRGSLSHLNSLLHPLCWSGDSLQLLTSIWKHHELIKWRRRPDRGGSLSPRHEQPSQCRRAHLLRLVSQLIEATQTPSYAQLKRRAKAHSREFQHHFNEEIRSGASIDSRRIKGRRPAKPNEELGSWERSKALLSLAASPRRTKYRLARVIRLWGSSKGCCNKPWKKNGRDSRQRSNLVVKRILIVGARC